MRGVLRSLIVIAAAMLALAAVGAAQQPASPVSVGTPKQYVFPAKGQMPELQLKDEAGCSAWATQQTGFDPARPPAAPTPAPTAPPKKGAGLRGAVRGAATGYIIRDLANDEGGEGAAIGAVVGGARARGKQKQRQAAAAQQQQTAQQQHAQQVQQLNGEFLKARTACLEAKGYTVK